MNSDDFCPDLVKSDDHKRNCIFSGEQLELNGEMTTQNIFSPKNETMHNIFSPKNQGKEGRAVRLGQ